MCSTFNAEFKTFLDLIYHVPFQRYFNCKNPQIKNFTKVQVAPLKKFKYKKKKNCFSSYFWLLYSMKRKEKEYSIIVYLLHFVHLNF